VAKCTVGQGEIYPDPEKPREKEAGVSQSVSNILSTTALRLMAEELFIFLDQSVFLSL